MGPYTLWHIPNTSCHLSTSRVKPSLTNYSSGKIHVNKIKIKECGRNHHVTAMLDRYEVQVDVPQGILKGKVFVYLSDNTVMHTGINVEDLGPEGLGKKWEVIRECCSRVNV